MQDYRIQLNFIECLFKVVENFVFLKRDVGEVRVRVEEVMLSLGKKG